MYTVDYVWDVWPNLCDLIGLLLLLLLIRDYNKRDVEKNQGEMDRANE